MGSQVLFGFGHEGYLDRLKYVPNHVDILEIYEFEVAEPSIKSVSLNEPGLEAWLNLSTEMPKDHENRKATGGLRFIFRPTPQPRIRAESLPTAFPHDQMQDLYVRKPLPFSRELFEKIIEKFHLPRATPWAFVTESPHFQRYSLDVPGSSSPSIGFTMRKSTRGVIAMNISLSISHDTSSGLTCALLYGCSDVQQAFIQEQVKACAPLASHPLLLPALLTGYQRGLLGKETKRLWNQLVDVETESGQTGAPVVDGMCRRWPDPPSKSRIDYKSVTIGILGVIQLGVTWESYIRALLLGIETIQDSISHISTVTPAMRKKAVETTAATLTERLTFLSHKSNVMLWDIQFINNRAQAQMTAVYNYIAQKDSEYSRQIAAASKRDSSAMKAIALLTMVFLPGTYIATLFAMPFFEFPTPSSDVNLKPHFWIYWAITIPLTLTVLIIYLAYLLWIGRRHREEDQNAREQQTNSDSTVMKCDRYYDRHGPTSWPTTRLRR